MQVGLAAWHAKEANAGQRMPAAIAQITVPVTPVVIGKYLVYILAIVIKLAGLSPVDHLGLGHGPQIFNHPIHVEMTIFGLPITRTRHQTMPFWNRGPQSGYKNVLFQDGHIINYVLPVIVQQERYA